MEPRASCMRGKVIVTELHHLPSNLFIFEELCGKMYYHETTSRAASTVCAGPPCSIGRKGHAPP